MGRSRKELLKRQEMKKQNIKTNELERNIVTPENGSAVTNTGEFIRQKVKEFNEEYTDVMKELAK